VRVKEFFRNQIYFAGYHREWSPARIPYCWPAPALGRFPFSDNDIRLFTVRRKLNKFIVTRIPDDFSHFSDTAQSVHCLFAGAAAPLANVKNTLILGGRYQHGETLSDISLAKESTFDLDYPTNMHAETLTA